MMSFACPATTAAAASAQNQPQDRRHPSAVRRVTSLSKTIHRPGSSGVYRRTPSSSWLNLGRSPAAAAAAASPGTASSDTDTDAVSAAVARSPSVTDMYVALTEMEREAEEAEVSCVESSGNSFDAQECTANFLEAADGIEQVRLAALASGTGSPEDRVVARAAVKRARQRRVSSVLEAEQDELDCVQDGGGVECTVAFNNAWEAAEDHERDAVLRHRSLLRRWIDTNKGR